MSEKIIQLSPYSLQYLGKKGYFLFLETVLNQKQINFKTIEYYNRNKFWYLFLGRIALKKLTQTILRYKKTL